MRSLLVAVALLAGSTTAGPVVEEAAAQLRRDPVFVHPDASGRAAIDGSQADSIRRAIGDGDAPIFVAALPVSAEAEAGGLGPLPAALGDATDIPGTYAVVTDNGFRADSNRIPSAAAADLATRVFRDHRGEGAAAVLVAYVRAVQSFDGSAAGGGGGAENRERREGGGSGLGTVLVLGGLAGGGVYLYRRKKRTEAEVRQALSGDIEDLRASLAVLADDVLRLESEVALQPEARDDYEAGVARFKWAQAAIDAIDSADDPPRVRRGMAEAEYAMARARAIVRGHEPPMPPEELQRTGAYGEPAVELDEERRPVYVGYGGYGGGWAGGGFFGGNGLFTGLLLGQMLGGRGWGGGFGWGGGGHDAQDGNDGGGWAGGGGWGGGGGGSWGGGGGGGGFGGGGGGGGSGGGDW